MGVIAQIVPLAESVPPIWYCGTERVVAWLIDELIALGHQVTLFASGDSVTGAELVAAWPPALRLGRPRSDSIVAQAALLEVVAQRAAEFDLVHCHIDWLHLPLLTRLKVPYLTTLHVVHDLHFFGSACSPTKLIIDPERVLAAAPRTRSVQMLCRDLRSSRGTNFNRTPGASKAA
jgi:glycosyltransferase involved in cell wall biosynthesis